MHTAANIDGPEHTRRNWRQVGENFRYCSVRRWEHSCMDFIDGRFMQAAVRDCRDMASQRSLTSHAAVPAQQPASIAEAPRLSDSSHCLQH